ncbi:hypothetical protein [Sphingobacterium sp. MYb382]|uniref:hypothetical protein n=1 Tax=Sphingobacterium sp. MYb382 TaxID=2745278 RepID=UPI0030AB321D
MKRNQFIAKRLRELFLDGKWIANTNYKEQLESVNWQQATHKVASLNTIAALTFHVNYYLDGLLQVFRGVYYRNYPNYYSRFGSQQRENLL